MATLTESGTIIAYCSSPNCQGSKTTYEFDSQGSPFGVVAYFEPDYRALTADAGESTEYRLFRCAACGRCAIGAITFRGKSYPGTSGKLLWFYPESLQRLALPEATPEGIQREFREAEDCIAHGCFRAAAGLFRSVLDKVLRADGYKTEGSLAAQINAAAGDGVITQSRKRRAHEDVRVLGNDVLHDEWYEITHEDVEPAHQYMQRILEDLYDDRESVVALLKLSGRLKEEDAEQNKD